MCEGVEKPGTPGGNYMSYLDNGQDPANDKKFDYLTNGDNDNKDLFSRFKDDLLAFTGSVS